MKRDFEDDTEHKSLNEISEKIYQNKQTLEDNEGKLELGSGIIGKNINDENLRDISNDKIRKEVIEEENKIDLL